MRQAVAATGGCSARNAEMARACSKSERPLTLSRAVQYVRRGGGTYLGNARYFVDLTRAGRSRAVAAYHFLVMLPLWHALPLFCLQCQEGRNCPQDRRSLRFRQVRRVPHRHYPRGEEIDSNTWKKKRVLVRLSFVRVCLCARLTRSIITNAVGQQDPSNKPMRSTALDHEPPVHRRDQATSQPDDGRD